MLYTIKDYNELEKINELDSLQTQVKSLGLQDKLGKQNCQEDMRKYLNQLLIQLKMPLKM